jgi:ABC-type sugar transport system substrate-binding protein
MTLSRRDVFTRGGAFGIGTAVGLPFAAGSLAAPRRQEGNNKVIFVTHDDNPFFVPVRAGLEQFGALAGWETQWVGPPKHDEVATLQYQLDAIAAKPAAVGFTRVNTTQFDDAIRAAQDEGIFVILYNTASDGYQDLGVAYVGQEFIPAGIVSGLNAAKHAKEITGRDDGIIILGTIAPGHSALDARMEGARQGIAQYNEENGTSYTTEDLTTSTDPAEAMGGGRRRYRRIRPCRLRPLAYRHMDRASESAGQVCQRRLRPRAGRAGRDRERTGAVVDRPESLRAGLGDLVADPHGDR